MAPLKSLTVRGFKSIRALEDFKLRDLNVLIGANGAGKSNFINLFRMLAELVEQRLQIFVQEHDGPDGLLFGTRKRTEQIDIELYFPEWRACLDGLNSARSAVASPEHVNDGEQTYPSARLKALRPRYEKVLHGPATAARIGLDRICAECLHFAAWVKQIETLPPLRREG